MHSKSLNVVQFAASKHWLLAIVYLLTFGSAKAQFQAVANFEKSNDIFGTRSFIENKGQFQLPSGEKVLYAYDSGVEKVYFTADGPVYVVEKFAGALKEWQREALEQGRDANIKPTESYYVHVNWVNRMAAMRLSEGKKLAHYFTYGEKSMNAAAFEKITYENVYQGIDIEYVFPSDKQVGIKYNVIARPNARLQDLQIAYSGDIGKIKLNSNGEIKIGTPASDIIEHAPSTFYLDGEKVSSEFVLTDKLISFAFPNGYDASKTLVVDPWVTLTTALTTNGYAYDIDYDFSGNVYVYGGYNPFKVAQYNSSGVLMWTFAGTIAGPSWSSAPILSQASNFAVNKYNSKTYIGQGFVGNGNRVVRLDATGNYDNFINVPNGNFQEVWEMGFHCTTGEVFVLGGGTSSNVSAVSINPTTAVINLTTFQPTNNSIAQDVVCHAIDDNGEIFIIYAGGSLSNKMCLVNPGFNNNLWTQPSTFNSFSEQGNKSQYQGAGSLSSNGFNCLAVNANFLFYYDGLNLSAYNKTTGVLVTATTISGLTLKRQGGIAVDDCNNIYLGGNGSILVSNFNGTTFSSLSPIPLAAPSASAYVYDIKLDKANKILYACGSGFVGVYAPVNTLSCPTASSACFVYIPHDFSICAGAAITLSVGNTTSLTNVTYSMQPGNVTNTTGSFVVSPTVTTSYSLYITGNNLGNIVVTNSAVSTVSVFAQPFTAPTTTQTTCTSTVNGFNLGVTFFPSTPTPTYSIQWSTNPGTLTSTEYTASGVPPGIYTATVSTSGGCISVATITIDPLPDPGTFTILPGGNYVLDCTNPVLTVTYMPSTLNYTTGSTSVASILGNQVSLTYSMAGTTMTVIAQHPTSGCITTQTYMVSTNTTVPTLTLLPLSQNITCSLSSANSVTATGNLTANAQYNWSSPYGGTLSANSSTAYYLPGLPGIYEGCLLDLGNGCQVCKNFTVTSSNGFPTFNVVSPQSFTLGCGTRSVATINIVNAQTTPSAGAVSYTILGPPTSTNYLPGPSSSFSVTVPGTWTVITKDNTNSCESKLPISILQNTFAPDVDADIPTTILTCATPSVILTTITSVTNAGFNWSYAQVPGNTPSPTLLVNANTSAPASTVTGIYTITVMNFDNNCSTSKSYLINQNLFNPKALITGLTAISCKTPTLTLTNSSSSQIVPPFNASDAVVGTLWTGPSPQEPLSLSTNYVARTPGTYTLLVTDLNNGCTSTATFAIDDARDYPPLKNPAHAPFVMECGANSISITPDLVLYPDYTYTWTAASGATIGVTNTATLSTNLVGTYWLAVESKTNGCASAGFIEVVNDTMQTSFIASPTEGYAPLTVSFTNTSGSSVNTTTLHSFWSTGTGTTFTTSSAAVTPTALYTQAGTYSVTLFAFKGECSDSAVRVIKVELPSELEVPNIFTPNGDGVNDNFFLKATNLAEIKMIIVDRWGHTVYEVNSSTGNVSWNGLNQSGKESPDGVYLYTIKATGKDGVMRDLHGNITLIR